MISVVRMLNDTECETHVQRLYSLRPLWRDRSGGHGTFFTLGRAAYLDVCNVGDESQYYDSLSDSNSLLVSEFGTLYRDLDV